MSGTASDPLLTAALWTGVFALASSIALLIAVGFMRFSLLRRLARERALAERWNPVIAECAIQAPERLPPLARRDDETFLVLWCRAQESLRGEAQEHLREVARRLDVPAKARRLAQSRKLQRRLLGFVALGHLQMHEVMPLLEAELAMPSAVSSLTAAQALLRIDPVRAVPPIVAAAAKREDWPLTTVMSILKEADPSLVGPAVTSAIRSELRSADKRSRVARLLKLTGAAHAEQVRDVVVEILSGEQDAESLAAALGCIWNPEDVVHARRLLGHAEWPVRVVAARTLGRLGEHGDFDRLVERLSDPHWWVRYRSAQALCALPGIGRAELDALRGRLQDRFASDILGQALAERAA